MSSYHAPSSLTISKVLHVDIPTPTLLHKHSGPAVDLAVGQRQGVGLVTFSVRRRHRMDLNNTRTLLWHNARISRILPGIVHDIKVNDTRR